jgi:hypothetical protein
MIIKNKNPKKKKNQGGKFFKPNAPEANTGSIM